MRAEFNTAYATVAASQTAQEIGVQKIGTILERLIIVPATTSPGLVTIIDGNVSINVFPGGASSVAELKPVSVEIGASAKVATSPGWKIMTGADVSVIAVGKFN